MGDKNQPQVVGALRRLHYGPGPHPSGSDQEVHDPHDSLGKKPGWAGDKRVEIDGFVVYGGKFELTKDKWAVEFDGKMASAWKDTPEEAVAEYKETLGMRQEATKEKEIRDQARKELIDQFKETGTIDTERAEQLADGRSKLSKNYAIGFLREEFGLRWTDAKNIIGATTSVGLTSGGQFLYDVETITGKALAFIVQRSYDPDSLTERAIMPDHEIDVDEIDHGWSSAFKDEGIYTTPVEPIDGIIALPIGALGLSPKEPVSPIDESEPESEKLDEAEKKSLLADVRRALGDLVDLFTKRHYGPGPHPSGTDQDVHGKGNGKVIYNPWKYNEWRPSRFMTDWPERKVKLGAEFQRAVEDAINQFVEETGIEPENFIFTDDLNVVIEEWYQPEIKRDGLAFVKAGLQRITEHASAMAAYYPAEKPDGKPVVWINLGMSTTGFDDTKLTAAPGTEKFSWNIWHEMGHIMSTSTGGESEQLRPSFLPTMRYEKVISQWYPSDLVDNEYRADLVAATAQNGEVYKFNRRLNYIELNNQENFQRRKWIATLQDMLSDEEPVERSLKSGKVLAVFGDEGLLVPRDMIEKFPPGTFYVDFDRIVERHGKHVGQEGRKGEKGGSAPGYTHADGAEDGAQAGVDGERVDDGVIDALAEQIDPDRFAIEDQQEAIDLAASKLAEAEGIEPEITQMLEEIRKETGGDLTGLDNRLKDQASLARKFLSDMEKDGISLEEASGKINDANRYTFLFESGDYVESVLDTQETMAEQGWTQYDMKWKNFFRSGDGYDGYNTVMVNEEGERFELQFHTPESINIKAEVHPMYEEFRVLPEGDPKRKELFEQMQGAWGEYEKPKGWENLPGRII